MFLPLQIQMDNRHGLIMGGSTVAARKCSKLIEYGVRITCGRPGLNDDPAWQSPQITTIVAPMETVKSVAPFPSPPAAAEIVMPVLRPFMPRSYSPVDIDIAKILRYPVICLVLTGWMVNGISRFNFALLYNN